MIVNHNMTAVNTYRVRSETIKEKDKIAEKLSSGLRVNSAGDDSAGLAISEKMRAQIRGLEKASKNAQSGISMIQTAEGSLNESHAILQRMRELAVQSVNETNTNSDRRHLQKEMDRLRQEVDRIAQTTEFNTKRLLTGNYSKTGVIFQVGANEGQTINLTFSDMRAQSLGVAGNSGTTAIDISTSDSAERAISETENAIEKISDERVRYGAMQNRLEHTIENLNVFKDNLAASESRIRDADMAQEIMSNSKENLILQSGNSMLAQANTKSQNVLQLLG